MNEKIRKLAEQSGLSWAMQADHDRLNMQEFAKAIIKECMRMCEVTEHGFDTHHATKEGNGAAAVKACIAEWFDIE